MDGWHVVGLDNGGTKDNGTVLDQDGTFLVDELIEIPSDVQLGPAAAVEALVVTMDTVVNRAGVDIAQVRAVGLDTPGPASADGVMSSKGATNFATPEWRGFDIRSALERRIGLPVVYNNDANAAALYAHHVYFGGATAQASSVSVIIGTGLGGGLIEGSTVIRGRAGMAGELGHVRISLDDGVLEPDQPMPQCNCGQFGDAESIASLTGIAKNLLPYWLTRYPEHPLHRIADPMVAAKQVRTYAEQGDEMSRKIFGQQARAIGRLLSIAANFTDPAVYFVGGGVVEAEAEFRDWFLAAVRANTVLRAEQAAVETITTVPDLDMAGARGSALAARAAVLADDSSPRATAG
ncbi:ROK family protein [Skermania piniformis]|uniref:ROK family protein n=1 Tax=Skermania pinensis TaxID=39122 RepID=A0ABX8S813_9ACTN|nr:ROK family protein [Skermania piniformis]QXQ13416.1 ROK family protein [Skermania piniformis]